MALITLQDDSDFLNIQIITYIDQINILYTGLVEKCNIDINSNDLEYDMLHSFITDLFEKYYQEVVDEIIILNIGTEIQTYLDSNNIQYENNPVSVTQEILKKLYW